MKIKKYEKLNNNQYKIYLDNNNTICLDEEVIVNNNLLYKHEITNELLDILQKENNYYDAYNKCLKYISIRLRSIKETKDYLQRKQINNEIITKVIDKLITNKYLSDEEFAQAFINDKLNFTTMGNYKIANALKKYEVKDEIINNYISLIDDEIISKKIKTLIEKYKNANSKKNGIELKNKTYKYLINLGYKSDSILQELNNQEF